ncbi:MAG: hypothetical protein MI976_23490, partial [Pseudomonadales bacterium]|nr:hypothetical protein [Pseudomonadales bacterium]
MLLPLLTGLCRAAGSEEELALSLFNRDSYSFVSKLYILNDPNIEVMSAAHARELDKQGYFKKNEQKYLNFGVLNHEIWVRFDVNYPASYPNEDPKSQWILETGTALMAIGELYEEQEDGSFSMVSSDIRTPFDEREINHVNSIFPLAFNLGDEKRFYLRLRVDGAFYMPARIWKLEAFTANVAAQEFIFGLFYGAMLCIIAFNFLIYLSVRDVSYVYYIIYLIAITLLFLIDLGHGVNFIDNSAQYLEQNKIST